MFFNLKGSGATSSFGGLLHEEGKLPKLQRSLFRLLASLFGIFLSKPACWVFGGFFVVLFFSELNCIQQQIS